MVLLEKRVFWGSSIPICLYHRTLAKEYYCLYQCQWDPRKRIYGFTPTEPSFNCVRPLLVDDTTRNEDATIFTTSISKGE